MKGWVNGNLYLPTSEQLGILPVPDDVRLASGMAEFNLLSADKKQPHMYARNTESHPSDTHHSRTRPIL